ncbi:uncharacterized protein DNG_05849 [Cephalotrichum gorgonifer]|uniref:Bacteriocin-protection protein n=1 Tax=Cephalotrichum gorgonifer TaxID=2041049 RepID=A0AAE8SWM6_9PEZI|nr:uncharacterized protein DNG_05849 [Cephalotrichum gorgonifer]
MPRITRSSSKIATTIKHTSPSVSPAVTQTQPVPPGAAKAQTSSESRETIYFKDSTAWESWLDKNHAIQDLGIWMKIGKKAAGIPSVLYDEAVNIALCYGWIDGQRKSHDEEYFLQGFTPRRKGSIWSKRNVDKVAALVKAGNMRPAGQAEVDAAKADGRWEQAYSGPSMMDVPQDFQTALNKNRKAKQFFETLGKSQRYPFLFRISTAKKAETRNSRIRQFVDLLAQERTLS